MSSFLLRSLRASLAMKFTAMIMLKMKMIVAITKTVAIERILLRVILSMASFRALEKSSPLLVLFFIFFHFHD